MRVANDLFLLLFRQRRKVFHDGTAKRIHRGHTYAEFLEAYEALRSRGIRVCVHIINGLPGETDEMMLETARAVGELQANAIKIHLLQIMEGTVMARQYAAHGDSKPVQPKSKLEAFDVED